MNENTILVFTLKYNKLSYVYFSETKKHWLKAARSEGQVWHVAGVISLPRGAVWRQVCFRIMCFYHSIPCENRHVSKLCLLKKKCGMKVSVMETCDLRKLFTFFKGALDFDFNLLFLSGKILKNFLICLVFLGMSIYFI